MASSVLGGEEWDLAYTVLVGIFLFGLLPLFIASFFTIPQRRDTARRGFIWLKIALGLMLVGVVLVTVDNILIILLNTGTLSSNLIRMYNYSEAVSRLSGWGYFILDLSSLFTFLAILDVALGILYCWDTGRRVRRILQWAAYGFVLLEVVLLLAKLGGTQAWYTSYYKYLRDESSSRSRYPSTSQLIPWRKVSAAFYILLGIASLALVGLTASAMAQARRRVEHRQAAVLVLVASILFCIQSLWNLASAAMTLSPQVIKLGTWDLILDAILGPWLQFPALVLLYVIGRKKLGGLWSTSQDFVSKQQYHGYADQPTVYQSYGRS